MTRTSVTVFANTIVLVLASWFTASWTSAVTRVGAWVTVAGAMVAVNVVVARLMRKGMGPSAAAGSVGQSANGLAIVAAVLMSTAMLGSAQARGIKIYAPGTAGSVVGPGGPFDAVVDAGVAERVVARDDNVAVSADASVTIDVLANDVGDVVAKSVVLTQEPMGVVTVNADGSLTYDPATSIVEVDWFAYRVCDTAGRCSTAVVQVTNAG